MLTNFIILFLVNIIISLILAAILSYHKKNCFWLLASICIFIPVGGILIAICMVYFLNHYHDDYSSLEIKTFSMPDTIIEKDANISVYAEGWAGVRLHNQLFPKEERIRALSIINKNIDSLVNKLNWLLLFDETEELRLYAFSLLEKQQDAYNKRIYGLMQEYKAATSSQRLARIEKQLAMQYWEMIHLNLIERDLRELILQKCYLFTDKALKILTKDADLWCLLANIHFEKNETEQAIATLTVAEQLKAPNSRTLPYLSEYSFKNKDYMSVKKYLSADNSFWEIPNLGKIVEFWCKV